MATSLSVNFKIIPLAIILLCGTVVSQELNDDPIVALKSPPGSLLRGHILKTDLGNNMYAFQDIPYAEAPIGKRRFKLPVYSRGWKGIRNATQTKQLCLQHSVYFFNPPISNYTEDCLVLSVYSPTIPPSIKKYPVMVWIHGGGFLFGGGNFYDFNPKYFIDEDVIVVTLNYRLGPMGFLSTGDGVIPANLGLYDQLLAMKWVNRNIDVFGGDPSNVVIAGESAGAGAVGWHLIGKKPAKYYSGAILQSGSSLSTWAYNGNVYDAAVKFVQMINPSYKPGNSTDMLNFLQNTSVEDLVAGIEASAVYDEDYIYVPTIDTGDNFAAPPTEAYDTGDIKQVPILVGFNSEEYLLFILNEDDAKVQAANEDRASTRDMKYNMKNSDRTPAFLALRRFYTSGNFSQDIAAFVRYKSDDFLVRGILRSVMGYSKYVPKTYLYQLAYNPSVSPQSPLKEIGGVGHSADLSLLFDQKGVAVNFTESDKLMSKKIVRIWANFVKYRNPTPFPEPLLDKVVWPRTTPKDMTYLNLSTTINFATNPRQCDQWSKFYDKYLQHPIIIY